MQLPFLLKIVLDSLFPEHCAGCKKAGSPLCEKCVLFARIAERETVRNITAAFDYRDPVIKRALWQLKYNNKRKIAEILGRALYERALEDISDMRIFAAGMPIIIIPVPLYRARRRERGYNQAELIAAHFAREAPAATFEVRADIVRKIKQTPPQARIANRTKRLANIRDAFALAANADVENRTIIVIDDITTTGGTITEIMKLLKSGGARKVTGFAVAH